MPCLMQHGPKQNEDVKQRPCRRRTRRGLRVFGADNSGSSALEFAMLTAPLILLMLAILQMSFVYFANFSLESAVNLAARMVRTGQAQSFNAAEFKVEVCKKLSAPITCGGLKLDVRKYSNFAGAATGLTQPLDGAGDLKTNFSYDPGARGDVVVVRAFYPLDIGSLLPAEISMSNMSGNKRVLVATAAFRNEPF